LRDDHTFREHVEDETPSEWYRSSPDPCGSARVDVTLRVLDTQKNAIHVENSGATVSTNLSRRRSEGTTIIMIDENRA
jgi:hypothetical protein